MSINFTISNLIHTKKKKRKRRFQRKRWKFFDPNQFKILGKKKKSELTEGNTERDAKTIMV